MKKRKKDKIIWALFINHRCNLNCGYCYLKNLNDGSRINRDVLRDIIDRIAVISRRQKRIPELGFFGKEPLLDFDLMQYAVSYLKTRKYSFSLSVNTNGKLLDREVCDFLLKNDFRIILSADINISEKNYSNRLFDCRERTDIRTTVNSSNLSLLPDMITFFYKNGFSKLSIAFDYSDTGLTKIRPGIIADYLTEALIRYIEITKSGGLLSVPLFDRIIESGIKKGKVSFHKEPFCELGKRIFSVDINGDIYPCWRFIEDERYRIGNIIKEDLRKTKYLIDIGNIRRKKVGGFDYICYWAYRKGGFYYENNIRIMQAMKIASGKISAG